MKPSFVQMTIVCLALSAAAAAQSTTRPGPESTNTNSNAPEVRTDTNRTTTPSAKPETSAAGATTPTTNKSKSGAPAQSPSTTPTTSSTAPTTSTTGAASTGAAASTSKSDAPGMAGTSGENKDASSTPSEAETSGENKSETATPKTPRTEMTASPSSGGPSSADPLLEPAPLPNSRATLVGGVAKKVDRIRNRVVLEPFGGGKKMLVFFDERSHIYRDGRETTILNVKPGDRVYVDTMLNENAKIFARNLRVQTASGPAEAQGQILGYDARRNTVRMLDKMTNQPVAFTITQNTQLQSKNGGARIADLQPGALVHVIFAPGRKGGDAREVTLLAVPGSSYVFAGRVTSLDLRNGILALDNQSDGNNYEIHFNPASLEGRDQLMVGTEIAANANFDGTTYSAKNITIMNAGTKQEDKNEDASK